MTTVVVVPCFNEAQRLDTAALLSLRDEDTDVLVVDDGSADSTAAIARAAGLDVLVLPHNVGKGEAVRHGLLHALRDEHVDVVAVFDADLATPTSELQRLIRVLIDDDRDVVLGSRVAHLGARIERRAARHYLGRLFATAASLALDLAVYDTQCGAKVFRCTRALSSSLASPFRARWAFDVELLARLLEHGLERDRIVEVPLRAWRDVGGSRLDLKGMLQAGLDVVDIGRQRRQRR